MGHRPSSISPTSCDVHKLLQKPSTTVIAAVRDPSHPTSKALADLPKGTDTQLIVVKLDSTVETDAAAAVAELRERGLSSLDVVIANAGIGQGGTSVRSTSVANTQKHFNVNSIGPLTLFQATADLLQASKTGSPNPYGASKAALNWFVRLLAFEEPWLTSFVFHPGLVETDLTSGGSMNLKALGAIFVDTSVGDILKAIWSIEPKDLSGTFRNHDGTIIPW
ncbi:aflatoxin biosynthesis ketoreductase Nor-1 [Diaporthe eres]|nr:aflatoxin biosynthesis ketoreductase Nor-1 [Diaporthe eres]